jgi:hypothetical protein
MAKDEIVDADAVAESSETTFLTGLVVFTTVALLAAFFLIEVAWKNNYGRGLLS